MKDKVILIEMLYDKFEQYTKTSVELYKLKAIDKTTDVLATLIAKLVLAVFFTLFFILITIGLALYIGDLLGKSYLGFFVLALIYGIIALILKINSKKILENRLNDYLVKQFFKEKEHENN